ncbi:unnamed protein product [Cladocopium goreaui]|uniref:Globin family profile domain-containing protein n=1 Tax=Cladocopium goreaui TaxID=2562237 RepID=A0A9P1G8M9_9DINO|nr:unnamed protein product [Cladocopium goreaui]
MASCGCGEEMTEMKPIALGSETFGFQRVEICSLLAASHPKSTSPWAALPRAIFRCPVVPLVASGRTVLGLRSKNSIERLIGNFILDPLPCVFSDWHAMSVVRNQQRSLHFGLRLHSQSVFLYNSGDAGIATCGPSIHADTGVWTVEVSLSAPVQLDGFCRADLGLVLDKSDLSERCASGIWWEAGDGDVFIGKDAGGSAEGWLGGAAAVENGILPSWHEEGSRVGLVLDTDLKILGFTKAGALQHFEWKVPDYAWPVHFGVGWSADIGGQFHLLSRGDDGILEILVSATFPPCLAHLEAGQNPVDYHDIGTEGLRVHNAAARGGGQSERPRRPRAAAGDFGDMGKVYVLATGGASSPNAAQFAAAFSPGHGASGAGAAKFGSCHSSTRAKQFGAARGHVPIHGEDPRAVATPQSSLASVGVVLWLKKGRAARGVLEALRLQLFQMMPISSIRITLWYTPQDGKMLLDKEAEKPFKEAGYRWFQLANRADSRRGQVMSQKRAQERDGKLPLETPDLCISSCLLVPGRRKVPVVDEVYREAPGNILVLAECIRKHCEDLQAASEPKVLQRTLEGLKEVKGSGSLVRSNCSADAKDWQDFAAECFKELTIPSELTAWLCRERPESVAKEGEEGPESQVEREVLCAGLALRVNWKAQRGDPAEPETFTEIAVQATATSRVTESPVVYVATEDDEISVMMCKLSASLPSDSLYEFASRLLKEAPPGDFEDDRLVSHVRLPRLSRCCVACTEAPQSDAETAFDFTFARELFGFRLSSRGTPLGALSVSPPREVLTLDGDFLLAVWHEKYVDLQVPMATLSDSDHEAEETEFYDEEIYENEGNEVPEVEVIDVFELNEQSFDELRLVPEVISETQEVWFAFISLASSRDAAGEAIYSAIFEAAPSLQNLFKTPRAVMAMRFMNGLNTIITSMDNPSSLKVTAETLGFQHLDLEVTAPRVYMFRDAIVELFETELQGRFTSRARSGMMSVLNYVGGAYVFIRREYASRIKAEEDEKDSTDEQGRRSTRCTWPQLKSGLSGGKPDRELLRDRRRSNKYAEFLFNAAVMGFSSSVWMQLVLEQFGAIVNNAANSYRLQEECDIMALRLAKYRGSIQLNEFKAVMLAALRSLVPRDWSSEHEVAWTWLWENVERLVRSTLGKPQQQERALERFIKSLTPEAFNYLRTEVYARFFQMAPAGQDHFKQSSSRLHFIADRVVEMTIDIYCEPRRMVEDISALGLRHVGYAIPTELFAPFVSCFVETVKELTSDELAQQAFRWSLTLISKMLVRTILEGSTVVMKAVNTNSEKQLRKAISIAPRGKRAVWLLDITVGSQTISPLHWALQSGSLRTAKAMIQDLLTIRADRDTYYYGCDELFARHPDIVKRLIADAEYLLPVLLDGLIWRSRVPVKGKRRVNYFVKHLMVDEVGDFSKALRWIVKAGNAKIICHPAVVLVADILWSRIASAYFLALRFWMLLVLLCFVVSQSVLPRLHTVSTDTDNLVMVVLRIFVYISIFSTFSVVQIRQFIQDIRSGSFVQIYQIPWPQFLTDWKERVALALVLVLIAMAAQEPILYCLGAEGYGHFTQSCPAGLARKDGYSTASAIALMLFFARITDLSILSTWASAFLLVCGRMLRELVLFLLAIVFLIVAFATSVCTLQETFEDFSRADRAMLSLSEMVLGLYPSSRFEQLQQMRIVMAAVSIFILISLVFLLNLLVAQLNSAYQAIFEDMVGFARLNRGCG